MPLFSEKAVYLRSEASLILKKTGQGQFLTLLADKKQ